MKKYLTTSGCKTRSQRIRVLTKLLSGVDMQNRGDPEKLKRSTTRSNYKQKVRSFVGPVMCFDASSFGFIVSRVNIKLAKIESIPHSEKNAAGCEQLGDSKVQSSLANHKCDSSEIIAV